MGTNKVATVVLFDVGEPGNLITDDGRSFFQRSKACLERLILRVIFSNEKDEIGIILIGTEASDNRLHDGEHYSNMTEYSRIQLPSFNMLEKVESLTPTSVSECDWVEGVILSLDFLKEETRGKRFRNKQLVVLSNVGSELEYSEEKLQPLVKAIECEDVSVIFIGVDMKEEIDRTDSQLTASMELMFSFVNKLSNGVCLSFTDAEDEFKFYQKKRKMKRLTKIELKIGAKISLPMKWMKLTTEETRLTWSKPHVAMPHAFNPAPSSADASDIKIPTLQYSTDVQKSTKFGETEVILSYADLEQIKLATGSADFKLLGTVKKQRITRAMIVGQEIYIAVPDGTARSHALVSALVNALLQEGRFGLARRILTTNGKIFLGLLIPVSDNLGKALYFVKLPYSDCIRSVPYRVLPEDTDPELSELMDEYIDAMTLDGDSKDDILLRDPTFQHRCHILYSAFKGEIPDPIDSKVPPFILDLMDPFKELKEKAEPILEKLDELYHVKYAKLEINKPEVKEEEMEPKGLMEKKGEGEPVGKKEEAEQRTKLTSAELKEVEAINEMLSDSIDLPMFDLSPGRNTDELLGKF